MYPSVPGLFYSTIYLSDSSLLFSVVVSIYFHCYIIFYYVNIT